MSDGLTELIQKLSQMTGKELAPLYASRFTKVRDYLLGLEEIRIFIANSRNYGHQASSVNILRNLIRMGCAGPYTLALYGEQQGSIENLIEKLKVLIVGFPGLDTPFKFEGCQVTAVNAMLKDKLGPGEFAITGGFDDSPQNRVPLRALNVLNYVQLQPYAWHGGNNLVIKSVGPDKDRYFYLDKLSPRTNLKRRAFYLPLGATPDWRAFANTEFKVKAEIIKYLTEEAAAERIHLLPAYGYTTERGNGLPYCSLYNIIAGALAAQLAFAPPWRKIVLIGMQELKYADREALKRYLWDAEQENDLGFSKSLPIKPSADFIAWNNEFDVAGRTECLFKGEINLDAVKKKVGTLKANQALYLEIGELAFDLFKYLYEKATLPPLLEGQSTAELMLNIGKPYFKIGPNDVINRLYPTLPVSSNTDGDMAKFAANASYNGIFFTHPDVWQIEGGPFPPSDLMGMFGAYLGVQQGVDPEIATYFTGLKDYFHLERNDKLLRALDLFVNVIGPKKATQLTRRPVAAPAVGSDLLEKLYASLKANLKNGQIDLLAVTANWLLGTFFGQLGKTFVVDGADVKINDDKTQVTLTGTTTALGVGATSLNFVFTDDNGVICSALGAVFSDATWSLPGAAWLSLSKPGLQLTLDQNAGVPVVGRITASMSAGFTMDIAVEIPSEPGNILFQAFFTENKPSITNFFQLVGGINLQSFLPQQLQILSDIEAQLFELRYDYKANKVSYVGIDLGTAPGRSWSLVPAVDVTGLSFSVSVENPGDLKNRRTSYDIGGQFTIGGGNVAIDAKLPGLRVSGGLADDSPPISLSSIVAAYLGNDFASALPHSIASTEITGLNFWVDRTIGSYSFSIDVSTDWKIPESSPLFVVTGLNLAIDAVSNAIDPGQAGGGDKKVALVAVNGGGQPGTVVTGSFSGSTIILPEGANIGLLVSASYGGKDAGWTFEAKQTSGVVKLADLISHYLHWDTGATLNIAGLGLTVTTIDGAWTFTGSTPEGDPWIIPFLGLTMTASLKAGKVKKDSGAGKSIRLIRDRATEADGLVPFAHLEAGITWQNIDLQIWFDYKPDITKFGITWNDITATMSTADVNGDYTATVTFDKNTTLGSIVETMVSWMTGSKFSLESPWDILNGINLSNLVLSFVFNPKDSTRQKVSLSVSIGPINLGIARIDGVEISYGTAIDATTGAKKKGVHTALTGSFPWNVGDTAVGDTGKLGPWDASKPGAAPAPPGQGNKYFDLRLLALGQHIAVDGLATADTVQKAIDAFYKLPDPDPSDPSQKPGVTYDAKNSWLVGTEFGVLRLGDDKDGGGKRRQLARAPIGRAVIASEATGAKGDDESGYMLTVQIVFDDPDLYALRIKLAGDVAKIFKGLDFQIMYRQVSDTVGVYQAEIVLPDAMRILSVGVYTVTLPVFGISIYTNGDFKVDIGFPWNEDFTRSFTIEGIIYPGIPVVGAAGFYFAKLSSATSNSVPRAINGTFNPVIEFGFGLQVGFGKSIHYGILSAGFSLTVFGIIEGVLGKWNPYQITDGSGEHNQLQGDYYFWLQGTVGIIGKLFGSIDFAIIKADVNVTLQLMLQLTYESYVSITVSVIASVDVSVSISIDLGLFSITIHFSFSMRLKETFTLPASGTPPWQVAPPGSAGLLARPVHTRLKAHRMMLRGAGVLAAASGPNWDNLKPGANSPVTLAGYLVPALAAASDEWLPDDLAKQLPCYVATLVIKSMPSAVHDSTTSALKATGQAADSPFEVLCKMVLRWAVAAMHGGPVTPDQADQLIVDDDLLVDLIERVLVSSDDSPTPIKLDQVRSFLKNQFRITIGLPPKEKGSADATFFPIAPEIKLSMPAYGANPAFSYTFAGYNSLDHEGLKFFRDYFDKLAVQVQQEMGGATSSVAAVSESDTLSMASWILTDYFLLLARQMVQAARDALRDFKYPIDSTKTVQDILDWIDEGMSGPPARGGVLQDSPKFTMQDLFLANPSHTLTAGSKITIGAIEVIGAGAAGTSFTSIAQAIPKMPFAPSDLAVANGAAANVLHQGATITVAGMPPYTVKPNDTLFSIAQTLGVPLAVLIGQSSVLTDGTLLQAGQSLYLPYAVYHTRASDTFTTIAEVYSKLFDAAALATQNAGRPILAAGAKMTCPGVDASIKQPYVVPAQGCLADAATYFSKPLVDLLSKAKVNDADILTATGLLQPAVALIVPSFVCTVSSEGTTADKTLQQIADRFGIAVEVIAGAPANLEIVGLFATVDAESKPSPYLDLPHLPKFRLSEIINEAQRSLALQHLSGMASRYYLHGLRLPTDHVKPNAVGMWVKPEGLQLPPMAGLYALTGQQVPVPSAIDGSDFTITLDRSSGPEWLMFVDGSGNPTNQLVIDIAPKSTDAVRIKTVSGALAKPLDIKLQQLGPEAMYESDLASYPLSSSRAWQSAAPIDLPYGTLPPGNVPVLKLWKLPSAMASLPDLSRRKVNPRFKLQVARYDEATGASVATPVSVYGWASVVDFTIKRVPDVNTASATTYEIGGAGASDTVVLQRLFSEVSSEANIDSLILAYASDGSSGIQNDAIDSVTMGIAKVNLSTETRPPASAAVREMLEAEPPHIYLLNSKLEFIRLLWEASITRTGGSYLYYYNTAAKAGLPDRIFNDKNEAVVSLIVIYSRPTGAAAQNRLASYMNMVATGEGLDTSKASLIAQADPPTTAPDNEVPVMPSDSLTSLAEAYFSNVGDLALANSTLPLAPDVQIVVSEGLYLAPPAGVPLSTVASNFATNATAIIDANKPWHATLPDTLTFPLAIRLPRLSLTVGKDPQTSSLQDIANYYGVNLTALAAYNRDVVGLFAIGGSPLTIPGGPRRRAATVPPGVQAFGAARAVPDPVPTDPTVDCYATSFLLNAFSLLNYQLTDTPYFKASPIGLPAGATTKPHPSAGANKLRAPMALAAGDTWEYRLSLPYPTFAKPAPTVRLANLPDLGQSPYIGVGRLMQVAFDWLDHYGNRIVTTLAKPTSAAGPMNQAPVLTGYTDALIGLGQWPSMSTAWHLVPANDGAQPKIELLLSFSTSRYSGLIQGTATNATTVTLLFTDPLDSIAAGDPRNYTLSTGISTVSIEGAALSSDGLTVTLTVAGLSDGSYSLTTKNLQTRARVGTGGQATFALPPSPLERSSTVQKNAQVDLRTYTQLFYQLTDPNGTALSFSTSLLTQPQGEPLDVPLTSPQRADLMTWLFGQTGSSVYAYLTDRSNFGTAVRAPAPTLSIDTSIDAAKLNSSEIFELNFAFTMARTGGAVQGDMETTPGIKSNSTNVAPLTGQLAQSQSDQSQETRGLAAFAQDFENALYRPGICRIKLVTGTDLSNVGTATSSGTLWGMSLGLRETQGIWYDITPATRGNPAVFSPRPISNQLQTRKGIDIRDYVPGQGISPTPTRVLDFVGIDMDIWVQQLFAAVDDILTPEYTASIEIVGTRANTGYLDQILQQKMKLAGIAKRLMIPVYKGDATDPTVIQSSFYQQLLSRLSNLYTVRAGLQFSAKVNADILPREQNDGLRPRIDCVTIVGADPTRLAILFSDPMGTSAGAAANYTVRDPNQANGTITINGAVLSSDRLTVTLSLTSAATPGQTSVLTNAAVTDAEGVPLWPPLDATVASPPRLFGGVVMNAPRLDGVVIPGSDPRQLTVHFSDPMDTTKAANVASYTVMTGATSIKVKSVAIQDQATFVLSLEAAATPNLTTVTVNADVRDVTGNALWPPLTLTVGTNFITAPTSQIALSSPKLDLATADDQPLALLIDAARTGAVRDASGEVVSAIQLDLRYNGSNVEHQIGASVGRYQPSSWLGFVIGDPDQPLTRQLGRFPVPMVLRSFPTTPAMIAQQGQQTPSSVTPVPLQQALQWDYHFVYSLPFHYPQDRVHGTIDFNIRDSKLLQQAGLLDAFDELAEFATVIPDIDKDLTVLATIDASTDPIEDKDKFTTASAALTAFVEVLDRITTKAGPANGSGLTFTAKPRRFLGTPSLNCEFYIQECSIPYGSQANVLLVTLAFVGTPPTGMGNPSVVIDSDTYKVVPYPTGGLPPGSISPACDGRPIDGTIRFGFIYELKATPGRYLEAKDGQAIARREVIFPQMDILQRQDAWSTIYLKRNEELVPGRPSADPFVYRTPYVQFVNPLHPTIDTDDTIDMSLIGSPNPSQPVTRTLPEQIQNFFAALLQNNVEPKVTIQVETTYSYSIAAGLEAIQLPILIQPPLSIEVAGSGPDTLDGMIADWSAAIARWFAAYVPSPQNGTLKFDLTIMSDLTEHPMPLLRLRKVVLPIQYTAPPPILQTQLAKVLA